MNTFYEKRPEKLFIGEMTHFPFSTHVHGMTEILCLTAGTAVITIDEMKYRLLPGDVAVIFPLVPHSYETLTEDIGGLTAIFLPDIIPEYAGTFHGLKPECPVLRSDRCGEELRLAIRRLAGLNMADDLPLCVAYLHVLLAGTLHSLTYCPVYDYSERGLGFRIIQYTTEHACEEITLENASHALGISASHLSHFFSETLHINFRRFINAIRVDKARLMMRDPSLTLTAICGACGYTNMRTFRRAFQAEMGCLPSDHQAALRNRLLYSREPEGQTGTAGKEP